MQQIAESVFRITYLAHFMKSGCLINVYDDLKNFYIFILCCYPWIPLWERPSVPATYCC